MNELEIRMRGNPALLLEIGAMEYETCAIRCVELTPEDCKQLLEMLNQPKPIKGSQQERIDELAKECKDLREALDRLKSNILLEIS